MRIIGGTKRGTKLQAPDGDAVRPTPDRVREALFNILVGTRFRHALDAPVIADVFAGTGMLGLEAFSRGAKQVVFVENDAAALDILQKNIKRLQLGDAAVVVPRDATRNLAWPAGAAGLLFLDPPWSGKRKGDDNPDLAAAAIGNLMAVGAIAPDAILSIEHDRRAPPRNLPKFCRHITTRNWGRNACSLFTANGG